MPTAPTPLRPPLSFPVSCAHCGLAVQATFWPEPRNDYKFSFGPIKVVVVELRGQILEWHLLCADCLLAFDASLAQRHGDKTRRYTLATSDRARLAAFLSERPGVVLTTEREGGQKP